MKSVMCIGDCKLTVRKAGYPNLDLAKFLCALLVVVIHTSPLIRTSAVLHFFLNDVVTRIAVPLFFAMSGFLFFRRIDFDGGRIVRSGANLRLLLRATRKNALLYLLWSVLYLIVRLPQWHQTGWWGMYAIKDWLVAFLFSGSYYHLWYLLAMIVALPALYVLLMYIPLEKFRVVSCGLWILECLTYSYAWVGADRIPLAAAIGSKMPIVFDALFRAVPLLFLGAFCTRRPPKRISGRLCVGAFLLCAAEASLLYFFSPNENKFSYLFATPVMTYALLNALVYGKQIRLSPVWQNRLRDMSLLIYCLHPMICYILEQVGVTAGPGLWLIVTVLSVGTAYLWALVKTRRLTSK